MAMRQPYRLPDVFLLSPQCMYVDLPARQLHAAATHHQLDCEPAGCFQQVTVSNARVMCLADSNSVIRVCDATCGRTAQGRGAVDAAVAVQVLQARPCRRSAQQQQAGASQQAAGYSHRLVRQRLCVSSATRTITPRYIVGCTHIYPARLL